MSAENIQASTHDLEDKTDMLSMRSDMVKVVQKLREMLASWAICFHIVHGLMDQTLECLGSGMPLLLFIEVAISISREYLQCNMPVMSVGVS